MKVAVLRGLELPSFIDPDLPGLNKIYDEDDLLIDSLKNHGVKAIPLTWSTPNTDWNSFDAAIIRGTFDYLDHLEKFLQVLSEIEQSSCMLFNSLEAVYWNYSKEYLIKLNSIGINAVETFILPKSPSPRLTEKLNDILIIKPAIGIGGSKSFKIPTNQLNQKIKELSENDPDTDYLVQPFVESIADKGEISFIYFNQKFSHAVIKKPAPGNFLVHTFYGGSVEKYEPSQNELQQVNEMIEKLPFDPLYARVDVLNIKGELTVLEIELIEPILYFSLFPEATHTFAKSLKDRLN